MACLYCGHDLQEIAGELQAGEQQIADRLREMVYTGSVERVYQDRIPLYRLSN